MELAIKVFVRSEADLPKEPGYYAVCLKESGNICGMPFDLNGSGKMSIAENWLLSVQWYYLPQQNHDQYPDNEADGLVFCGKCGKLKSE